MKTSREQMKKIEVSAGILVNGNQILCLQRGPAKYDYISFKYEFPGGKLEPGESPKAALQRELMEEMKLSIDESDLSFFMTVNHQYPDFFLTMHSFICNLETREFELIEHVNYQWLNLNELTQIDWAEADRPLAEKLMSEGAL
jgi:8-oxo-dGTP diphosphatase